MLELLLQVAQPTAWVESLPVIVIASVTLFTTIIATIKAFLVASSVRVSFRNDITETCERLDAIEITQEKNSENLHQITQVISGINGTNGLNGRVKDIERKMQENAREISEIRGELKGRFGQEDEN